MGTERRTVLRAAVLAVLLVGSTLAVLVVGVPDADELRARAAGVETPVLVLVYAGLCLLPVPRNVLSVAAGLLLGLRDGLLVALPGALLAAVAAFWIGRRLGREAVERFTGARVARVDALLARRGVVAVLACRLLPVVPFVGVNYAAGLTGVRFRDYLVGTAIGIVPGAVAYVAVGALGTSPTSWPFVAAVLALLLLSLAGTWFASRRRRVSGPASPASVVPAPRWTRRGRGTGR